MYIWILSSAVLLIIGIFLGTELLKKFRILERFTGQPGYITKKSHNVPKDINRRTGMKVMTFQTSSPCLILVGLKLKIPFIKDTFEDWYGAVETKSTAQGFETKALTYVGSNGFDFYFITNSTEKGVELQITISEHVGEQVEAVFKPHWWQRIGLWS